MKLSQAIEALLLSTEAGGRSGRTVEFYRMCLSHLMAFVGDRDIGELTSDDLLRFLVYLRTKPTKWEHVKHRKPVAGHLSPSSVHCYVRAIRRLFNFLVLDGRISAMENIAARMPKPKLAKLPPKDISPSDFRALLDAAKQSGRWAARNYAIVLFLMDTGCRVGGLVGLRLDVLDVDKQYALVTEKGLKPRAVFFAPATEQALRDWLLCRSSASEFVFVNPRGEPMSIAAVAFVLRRLKRRAGVSGHVNPHSFRHAFAKRYLNGGGDLATLADLLGHADVVVTKNSYSIFLTEELRRKHDLHLNFSELIETPS